MGGVDEADIISGWEPDAEAAGGALVIVDFENLAAKGGRTAVFEFVGGDFGGRQLHDGRLNIPQVREVAGDQSLAHETAVFRDRDEVLETIGEAGEHASDFVDWRRFVQRGSCTSLLLPRIPKAVFAEIKERQIRAVPVIELADDFKSGGKALADFLTPGDVLGSGKALVDEIEDGEKKEWFT